MLYIMFVMSLKYTILYTFKENNSFWNNEYLLTVKKKKKSLRKYNEKSNKFGT